MLDWLKNKSNTKKREDFEPETRKRSGEKKGGRAKGNGTDKKVAGSGNKATGGTTSG